MKSLIRSLLHTIAVTATVSLLTTAAVAKDPRPDRAAELLARHGSIPLSAFGDYVEVGTFAIQVSVKLGEPDSRLPDGTWLYDHRRIADSDAEGTVVVCFKNGRVSNLSLATHATVARLRAAPAQSTGERLARR
jgi:hypothetical protein